MKPFLISLLALALATLALAEPKYDPAKLPKGHDYFELRDGLANCQRKFTQEKSGRVIFLGGSITAGGAWRQHLCDYLTRKFPDTKFEFINAGIGSMGSVPHAFRLERGDVLSKGPGGSAFRSRPRSMTRRTSAASRSHAARHGGRDPACAHDQPARRTSCSFILSCHRTWMTTTLARCPRPSPSTSVWPWRMAIPRSISPARSRTASTRVRFTWAEDFENLHPSPFGHQLYANSIARMLDAAFAKPIAASGKEHPLPTPIDAQSYAKGRLGDIAQAKTIQGFALVPSWTPDADEQQPNGKKIGVREGFVNVPALVGTEPGAEFEFSFEGSGCGLFIASGPDAGQIEFRIDSGPARTLDTLTHWSSGLHLPWALILDDQLKPGPHTARVRLPEPRRPPRRPRFGCFISS